MTRTILVHDPVEQSRIMTRLAVGSERLRERATKRMFASSGIKMTEPSKTINARK